MSNIDTDFSDPDEQPSEPIKVNPNKNPNSKELPTEEEVKKALDILMRTPDVLDKIIGAREKVVRRRRNHSKLANSPYYTARYAEEFKIVIDDMLERGVSKEYRYEDYKHLSPRTVYLRVNQAKLFLLDNLDPDGKYEKLLRQVHIRQEKSGVRLNYVEESEPLKAVDVGEDEKISKWKPKVDEYVANAKPGDKPLHLKDLSLTQEEVDTQNESFADLPMFIAFIRPTEIKIVRIAE